jgi:UDP:flavonoid glycosyltransferase YjiC (YdhE family)
MNVLLATIGSGGDVHPYIALGAALQRRGHRATLLSNPYFQERIERAGLGFAPLGTREEYLRAVAHPDLVHRSRGPAFVLNELVLSKSREMFVHARKIIRAQRVDLVVRHLIAFGAGWAAQREGVREVSATLSPLFWLSTQDPGVFRHWEPRRYPRWLAAWRLSLAKFVARFQFDPGINVGRAEAGLPAQRDAFVRELVGGERTLGLWSGAFRPAQGDDPAHGRICGFTWYDGSSGGLDPALQRFLDSGRPGDEPVVFTLGTSVVHHAGDFFALCARVCRSLGRRGVLLTGPSEAGNAPPELPSGLIAVPYASFAALLPRACATVHHGGLGTTAQALRAGRPSLVIPFANDEFDQAARVHRLGLGGSLYAGRLSERRLRAALASILSDQSIAQQAAAMGERLRQEDGAERAVDELESLIAAPARSPQP